MLRNEEIDKLTMLSNLYSFREKAQEIIDDPAQRKLSLAVIYFDIVNFKNYNARYGFEAGDRFLQNMGSGIRSIFSELIAARFSDDHFAALVYNDRTGERIEDLHRNVLGFNTEAEVDMRAGIYVLEPEDTEISICCDRARMACKNIKSDYGKIYRVYDREIGERINLANYIIHHVSDAILKGHVQVYYQPVVRVINGRVCGFEALARWIDPEHGFLMPGDFVPILEDAHLIYKLDAFVIRKVCEDIRYFIDLGMRPQPVSINLSRADFHQRDMYRIVNEAVENNNIPRNLIHVEITESAMEDISDILMETMDKFRKGGYEVWMDDFGSGYSSLNLLKNYEFDVLKFDMKFLQDFGSRPRETAIWENVINMAEEIGIQTLAEGVETLETWDFLKRVGCEKAQGYFFGRPMTRAEVIDYLDEDSKKSEGSDNTYAGKDGMTGAPKGASNRVLLESTEDTDEASEPEPSSREDDNTEISEIFTYLAAESFASLLEYDSFSEFLRCSFHMTANISRNSISHIHISDPYGDLAESCRGYRSYEQVVHEFVDTAVLDEDRKIMRTFTDRERLILAYQSGVFEDTIEYHGVINVKTTPRWTRATYQMQEENGDLILYMLAYDIDEFKRSRDLVRQMAERDALTGLYNRYTAIPLIRNRLYRHQNARSAMVLMEVDDFRQIVSSFGTLAGDEVLRRIAARIDDVYGRDGIVCHVDRESFLIFLEEIEEEDIGSRIDRFYDTCFDVGYGDETISFTVSCGYVMHPDKGRGYHDLYRKADIALGEARSKGRGLAVRYRDK